MKYGLLSHRDCINIGDTIQSVAVQRLLPRVDLYIDRDYITEYKGELCLVVMNGWFLLHYKNWPPPSNIVPLFFGFHAHEERVVREHVSYFKQWEPIGCRDLYTMQLCVEEGIQAYFSGCLTLTLKNTQPLQQRQGIYVVNCKKPVQLPPEVESEAIHISHGISAATSIEDKIREARGLLNLYQKAELVITSLLHCALPCAAFNTPCLFVPEDENDTRFSGYKGFLDYWNGEVWRQPVLKLNKLFVALQKALFETHLQAIQ